MGVRAAYAAFAVFALLFVVKAEVGGVTFWKKHFTMTCPGNGSWYEGNNKSPTLVGQYFESLYEKKQQYYCKYDDDKTIYKFYVEANVCENCYELDPTFLGLAIILDILLTSFVIVMIFKCTNKKRSATPAHTSRAPASSGSYDPSLLASPYEQLNPRTRSQDTYATKMG